MPRHDTTNRIVRQSLTDIDENFEQISRKRRSFSPRYTSVSTNSSNVSPMKREHSGVKDLTYRKKTTRGSVSQDNKADVVDIHTHERRRNRSKLSASSQVRQNNRQSTKPRQKQKQPNENRIIWYPKRRARLVAIALLIPFLMISLQLVNVQILRSKRYSSFGVNQRRLIRDIVPDRANITDRNGNLLAVSTPAYSVIADPSLIKDDDGLLSKLHKVVVFDDTDLVKQLKNKKSRYAVVVRHIDDATAKRVRNQELPGISVISDPKREYPAKDIAPNVIGFVGSDMNGLGGIEYMMDSKMAGKKGQEVIERDPTGREITSAKRSVKSPTRGQDVVLTLDEGLQFEAQRIALEEVQATGSKGATVIVGDVKTGEILVMASIVDGPLSPKIAPSTDRNHAVTDVYEPGSTNKVITISGALQDKVISTGTRLNVPDKITFDNKDFVDHDPHGVMDWNAQDILRESSNVGTIMISNKLKKARLDYYLRAYGFGTKTAVNFPGEASGILLDTKDWSDTSIATVPIGNGLAVTPLQMLSVYMTIANNGLKEDPTLIKSFIDSDGNHIIPKKKEPKRVISEATAKTMQSMLQVAVQDGTGKLANIPGYSVGGKTGTARKPPYNKPPYKYIASFAGFAPASNPRLAAIVVLDEPQGNIYGGTVAAPVFSRVMQSSLRVMGISPDRDIAGQSVTNEPSITTTTTTTSTTLPINP